MDILAARKKAAERIRKKATVSKREEQPAPPESVAPAVLVEEPPVHAASAAVEPSIRNPQSAIPNDSSEAPAPEETAEPQTQDIELLAFRLGKEEYCVMVEQVREVLKMRDITPVPHTPEHVLGVTSIRGRVLPVIDLCKRLGLVPGERDEKSRIVVITVEDEDMGILVDRMTGVVRFPPDAIRPAPDTIEQGAGAEFLRGIARKDDKLYILLDVDKAVGK